MAQQLPTRTEGWQSGHISVDGKDQRSNTTYMSGAILASTEIRISTEFDSAASTTAGVQEAVDDLPATGGMIFIPPDTHNITTTITIDKPCTIMGSGEGTIMRVADGVDADISIFTAADLDNITIKNMILDGNEENQAAGDMFGVHFDNVRFSKIDVHAKSFSMADRRLVDCNEVDFNNRYLSQSFGAERYIIEDFQDLTDTAVFDGAEAVDATVSIYDQNSIQITTDIAQVRHLFYIIKPSMDLSFDQFEFYFYIPDADYIQLTSFSMRFRNVASGIYFSANVLLYVSHIGNGWHKCTVPKGAMAAVGGAQPEDWMDIDRIDFFTTLAATYTVHYGAIYGVKMPQEGAVVFSMDDGTDNQYDVAKVYFTRYGVPATLFVITENIDTPTYMTWEELRTLQGLGWDVCCHGKGSVSNVTSDYYVVLYDNEDAQRMLSRRGFSKGARFFAAFGGQIPPFNDPRNDLLDEIYLCVRNIGSSFPDSMVYDPQTHGSNPLQSFSVRAATTLADMLAEVDSAKKDKSLLIFNFHTVGGGLDITVADLEALLDYITDDRAIPVRTLSDIWDDVKSPRGISTAEETTSDIFMNVLALDDDYIRSNEDLSAAVPITFTLDAQPDVPRTLTWKFDAHVNVTEFDLEIVGVNSNGVTVTETFDEGDGWLGETDNAFATVTSVTLTSRTGTGVGDTMDIGIESKLGLSRPICEAGDVYKVLKNTGDYSGAGDITVDDDNNTVDVTTGGAIIGGDDFTISYMTHSIRLQ